MNLKSLKELWTTFRNETKVYQILIFFAVCAGVVYLVSEKRYSDKCADYDRLIKDKADDKTMYESRIANIERKHDEEVGYLQKKLDNKEIEMSTMVKDGIRKMEVELSEYKHQLKINYEQKIRTNEKR